MSEPVVMGDSTRNSGAGETGAGGPDTLPERVGSLPGGAPLADEIRTLAADLTSARRDFKRQSITYTTIIEIANRMNASGLDLRRIESFTASMVRGQFGVLRVFLCRADVGDDANVQVMVPDRTALDGLTFGVESAFARWCVEHVTPITADRLEAIAAAHPEARTLLDGGITVAVPLVHTSSDGRVELVGLLGLGEKIRKMAFNEADLELLEVLSNMIAIALHNAHLYHRSIVDGLTRVFSRGHFDAHLGQEVSRARRHLQQQKEDVKTGADATRLSLVMLDIDHFKAVNDTHGHQAGDEVLRAVGALLKDSVRAMDIVSRYGGEEFAVVFPETRQADALRIAERLRIGFAGLGCETPGGDPLPVSASFGVATWPDDAEDVRSLVAAADKALYRAKESGRDRVVTADPIAGGPEKGDG